MGNEGVVPDIAVVDAGPIIHLAQVDALDLLSMFERVLVPRTVYFELADEGLRSQLETVGCELVDVSVDESLASLDSGETAAITLAMEVGDAVLLTDDLDARDAAIRRDIEVHGSIGVIAVAYSRGIRDRTEAENAMRSLHRDASLFVAEAVVERGLELLDRGAE